MFALRLHSLTPTHCLLPSFLAHSLALVCCSYSDSLPYGCSIRIVRCVGGVPCAWSVCSGAAGRQADGTIAVSQPGACFVRLSRGSRSHSLSLTRWLDGTIGCAKDRWHLECQDPRHADSQPVGLVRHSGHWQDRVVGHQHQVQDAPVLERAAHDRARRGPQALHSKHQRRHCDGLPGSAQGSLLVHERASPAVLCTSSRRIASWWIASWWIASC